MRYAPEQLSPADWSVLALVAERRTHGFAVARALAPDGGVGRVWMVRRPLVYRSIETLTTRRLIEPAGQEPSTTGPPRAMLTATADGHRRVAQWLREPVTRVREARSELMLKLLFLERADQDRSELVHAQRDVLAEHSRQIATQAEQSSGFESVLAIWRLENTLAALRFCDALIAE
ncbi:MAG TPA: hypothetical protein VES62_03935 [Thermoleophilaceae bacterium]|jgi:DNA-binding PadR family transcriptional regulator|nr:helix-turn-helix transcriptional regulator [Actinomycetota bacterium]HYN50053.1 hypothetical protein [Thermoleophilaceae bacterium]